MASVMQKVANAFVHVPHGHPTIKHRRKILLGVSSAQPRMPDHTSGFFWGELLHAAEAFAASGWDVDIVSETGMAHPDESSLGKMAAVGDVKKWEDKSFWLHSKLQQIRPAASITNLQDYAAIYFAGGHACCVDFPTATNLKLLTARIYEQGGIVGADCHGPAIFEGLRLSTGVPLLQGKMATGFSTSAEQAMPGVFEWMKQNRFLTMQEIVQMNGGLWHEHSSNPMGEYVQVDGRLVTGMNPASAKGVAEQMIKLLPQEEDLHHTGTTTGVTTGTTHGATTGLDKSNVPLAATGETGPTILNKMEQRHDVTDKSMPLYTGEVARQSAIGGQGFNNPQPTVDNRQQLGQQATGMAGHVLARNPTDATDRTQTQPEAPLNIM